MSPFDAPHHPTRSPTARLAPAPRRVPLTLRVRLLLGGLGVFAWIWLGFGGALATFFLRHADLTSWALLRGDLAVVEGVVEGCTRTSFSEGGSKGSVSRPVFAHRFRFDAAGGAREAVSFATGVCVPEGEAVRIEHPPGRPELARIQGMRRAEFGPSTLFILLFPLVGVGLVGATVRAGARRVRLLSRGALGLGALVASEETSVSINDRPVRRLRFALETERGERREVVVRTHLPEQATDEPRERILYDPARAGDAVAWDLLPGFVRTDGTGQLEAAAAGRALLLLVPPLAAAVGIALALGLVGP